MTRSVTAGGRVAFRRRRVRECLVILPALVVCHVALFGQQSSFRGASDVVRVFATVYDRNGNLIDDLRGDDFEVLDEGRPVQLTVFGNEPLRINAALLVDAGSTTAPRMRTAIAVAERFLGSLVPSDRALVVTFNDEVAVYGPSNLFGSLFRRLETELWPGGASPLWTAMRRAMDEMGSTDGRRTLVLVGDGQDLCPSGRQTCESFDRIRQMVLGEDFLVYLLGLAGTGRDQFSILCSSPNCGGGTFPSAVSPFRLTREMERLISDSGGAVDRLERDSAIDTRVAKAISHLRHQYVLGFQPLKRDGKEHRLRVRVLRPGAAVHARGTYVAPVGP